MQELVKIEKRSFGKELIDTANARDLHEFLGVKTKFADWITSRVSKYGFKHNLDFISVSEKTEMGGYCTNYHVSIDTAKELGMVENNKKGMDLRRWFIERDKKLSVIESKTNLPQTFSEALQLAADQAKQLEEQKPKVEFHDQVLDSSGLLTMSETAKTLNLGYGRNTFFKNLREMKIFFKREPYQKYIDQEYFEVKATENNGFVQKQAFTTPKGLEWLQKKFKKM